MFAAIYARKSTEQVVGVADDQKSVARQIEHSRAFAATKGWTVDEAHVYVDDGISGAEFANRPGIEGVAISPDAMLIATHGADQSAKPALYSMADESLRPIPGTNDMTGRFNGAPTDVCSTYGPLKGFQRMCSVLTSRPGIATLENVRASRPRRLVLCRSDPGDA